MYLYQFIIVIALSIILIKTKNNGEISSVVAFHLISVLIYFTLSASYYNYYYMAMCLVLIASAKALRDRFKLASLCSCILVPINIVGYFLWSKRYPHDLYDFLSAIMLIIQFISILPRALTNGVNDIHFLARHNSVNNGHSMVGPSIIHSNKKCDTITYTLQDNKSKKCQTK